MRAEQRSACDDLMQVERSDHGGSALFDSFSESCNGSREGSRKGPLAQSSGQGVLATALQQRFKAGTWRDGNTRPAGAHSLHSGTDFYKSEQQHQHQARGTAGANGAAEDSAPGALLEGSVSRHRGAQFYAQAAARWKAVAASGSQKLLTELESESPRRAPEQECRCFLLLQLAPALAGSFRGTPLVLVCYTLLTTAHFSALHKFNCCLCFR